MEASEEVMLRFDKFGVYGVLVMVDAGELPIPPAGVMGVRPSSELFRPTCWSLPAAVAGAASLVVLTGVTGGAAPRLDCRMSAGEVGAEAGVVMMSILMMISMSLGSIVCVMRLCVM
jgi:hypothetical protein